MANMFKNIILILILSAVIIMMIGIVFYDYIPNRVEVKEANEYVVEEKTTRTLATIKDEEETLFGNVGNNDSEGHTETIIHAYSLDAGDLRVFEQSNLYQSGKSDPFDDIASSPVESGNPDSNNPGTSVNGTTNNNSNGNVSTGNNSTSNNTITQENDGTLFNSTTSK